ncbi:MAG: pyrroloquinoline quinone biosynthesis peptide chaperone PqqD [Chloroflexota bacterium]
MQPTDRPARKADYRLEQLDDELLLYHPNETRILYLNPTASLIWGLCDGERSVAQIIAVLEEAYPEAQDAIAGDVQDSLAHLLEQGCIELR